MSDSDDERSWCPFGGNVPPPSPSKARVLPIVSAKELVIQRQKFWAAYEDLQKVEAPLDDSTPSIQLDLQPLTSPPAIQLSHPGSPRRCWTTRREPDFDPVSFVLGRCRADPALAKRFTRTDRKQFLSVLHRGFSYEGFECWSREERVALAGHLLLLGAIASCEVDASACGRHLRSERCDLDAVVTVALAWGAASEDLLPRQDLSLTGVTPAQPSSWCLTHTLRTLTSLLRAPTQPKFEGTESSSGWSSVLTPDSSFECPTLAKLAMTARALALCALDAAPGQAAEYIPVLAAVLAAAKPWTEEAVASMADALHFPDAHPHSQAWLLADLVLEQPLRTRMAHRQLLALLASTTEPMSGITDEDDHHETEEPEAMEVQESPALCASTVYLAADLNEGFPPLAGLVRLLSRQRRVVDAMDVYRKFIFLLNLEAMLGNDPVSSTEDVAELQNLIAWLPEITMKQPAGTCQVDAVMVQSLVAMLTSLWQRAVDRFDADVVLSQGSQDSTSQYLVP